MINIKIVDSVVNGRSEPILKDTDCKELEKLACGDDGVVTYEIGSTMPERDYYTTYV